MHTYVDETGNLIGPKGQKRAYRSRRRNTNRSGVPGNS